MEKNTYEITLTNTIFVEGTSEREALQKIEKLMRYLEKTEGLNLEEILDIRCVECNI